MLDQTLTSRFLAPLPCVCVHRLPTLTEAASPVLCLALITEQDKKRKVIDYQKKDPMAQNRRGLTHLLKYFECFIPIAGRSEAVVNIP